ncbi:SMI1/KNR4 family protein [Streptomyces sp. ISL-22]|uniref:Knr4/Smi1-like domain-containing protein n=1 Tax=Streptomyces curacoi TaxID=146536 RepID=A0A117PB35_9ACTN|nr:MULTISPECIES: SMI1/KNR4 family protein [Streptomyces]KUM76303.1 hypothetical protein AQI70_15250 [Streptomyces curacoi]MBT2423167.1 SMI1/KNR4 family protein [Streptomyces sp. ISL-24]MBT2431482.1 SMI1/KNR4 family protein [Streptomyces sp. ISL-22]
MTGVDALEELRQLMPPGASSNASVDWARMRESWGKDFPSDYRQFLDLYGFGGIQNYLSVLQPEPKGVESKTSDMRNETEMAEDAWSLVRKSPELAEASPVLIAWGGDASADLLCWDASDEDPDRWPVLVYKRGEGLWRRYDCGMVQFLVRVLRAEFDECPLGDLSLWGRGSATFLNRREQQRLWKEGIDPWTGEPDPFAGMFGD